MITWRDPLICDSEMQMRLPGIKHRLENGMQAENCYCLILPANPENVLEIVRADEQFFSFYRQRGVTVLGLAGSRREAVALAKEMITRQVQETGQAHFDR